MQRHGVGGEQKAQLEGQKSVGAKQEERSPEKKVLWASRLPGLRKQKVWESCRRLVRPRQNMKEPSRPCSDTESGGGELKDWLRCGRGGKGLVGTKGSCGS